LLGTNFLSTLDFTGYSSVISLLLHSLLVLLLLIELIHSKATGIIIALATNSRIAVLASPILNIDW
jgi:hypothetical protein